jgi:hypothetical protein
VPPTAQGGGGGGGLFSSLRGGAGNFLKNLKDTTGKVMQTVQQWVLCRRNIIIRVSKMSEFASSDDDDIDHYIIVTSVLHSNEVCLGYKLCHMQLVSQHFRDRVCPWNVRHIDMADCTKRLNLILLS